jgi:hypothetical protein
MFETEETIKGEGDARLYTSYLPSLRHLEMIHVQEYSAE